MVQKLKCLGLFMAVTVLLSSCGIFRSAEKVKFIKKSELEEVIHQRPDYTWLTGKTTIRFQSGDRNISAKSNFKIRKDSAIWLSISPALNIEMARVLILEDSLSLINKLNKEYLETTFAEIHDRWGVEIGLPILLSFFEGKPFGLDHVEKIRLKRTRDHWELRGEMKRKTLRSLKPNKDRKRRKVEELLETGVVELAYQFDPAGQLLSGTVQELQSQRLIQLNFNDFERMDGEAYPTSVLVKTEGLEENFEIELNTSRLKKSNAQKLHFRVPSRYEKMSW